MVACSTGTTRWARSAIADDALAGCAHGETAAGPALGRLPARRSFRPAAAAHGWPAVRGRQRAAPHRPHPPPVSDRDADAPCSRRGRPAPQRVSTAWRPRSPPSTAAASRPPPRTCASPRQPGAPDAGRRGAGPRRGPGGQAFRRPRRPAARPDAGGHPADRTACTSPTSSTGGRPATARRRRRRRRCAGLPRAADRAGGAPRSSCCSAEPRPSTARRGGRHHEASAAVARMDDRQRKVRAIATLHPAYLLRAPAAKRLAWRDLLAVKAALGGSAGVYRHMERNARKRLSHNCGRI